MPLKRSKSYLSNVSPAKVLLFGYLSYVAVGWVLLSLPFSQAMPVASLDNLFIVTSAVSTTGLVTVDPGQSYSFIGQLVILVLIQLGGIGYMTFGSFIILSTRHKMSSLRSEVSRKAFALPGDFRIARFIRLVITFTLITELIGAILLYAIFSYNNEDNAIWLAIFHSISAFCTAGFSLFSNSFESYADNVYLNLVIATLSYLGAIGFIVMVDVWHLLTGKSRYLHFASKVILEITFWFSLVGTILFFVMEPSIQALPNWERLLASFFQVMTAGTTVGFNTIPIGALSASIIMFLYMLMIFGASPSGTGGGLKSTTLAALIGLMRSVLKGRDKIRYQKREISADRLQLATAAFTFYMGVLFLAMILLLSTEEAALEIILFEAISALGTVGLSMGLTGDLTNLGKLIIIVLMFMGRVGILTFGIAVSTHDETREEEKDNDLVL
jgi:trk system potassium uptake protein TrkH